MNVQLFQGNFIFLQQIQQKVHHVTVLALVAPLNTVIAL